MVLKAFSVVLSMLLVSCANNVPNSSAIETTPTVARLSFLDISKFDRDLSASLLAKSASVEVAFYEKVSPNNVPVRLQKWISVVEADGGKVSVEPPASEVATRSPFAAISLIGSLISSIKAYSQLNAQMLYQSAKGRDAIISLERNNQGEVVVSSVKFVNRNK